MAFTAMVGKELLQLDYDASPGKTILSTYVPSSIVDTETLAIDEESSKDATSEDEKEGVTKMKATRPKLGGMLDERNDGTDDKVSPGNSSSQFVENADLLPVKEAPGNKINGKSRFAEDIHRDSTQDSSKPRRRFTDSLSSLQIEEAKATGRAQLGLAFEMLTMMKKRALRADPEAYQCLIDACGRVGDTKRATELLAKMHEDGIVADGTVYACLVSAFSSETAWKKGTKEEDLPGKCD